MEVNGNDFLKNVHKEQDDGRRRLDEFQQSSSQYDDYENPKDNYYNEKNYDEPNNNHRYDDEINIREQEYADRTADYTDNDEVRQNNSNNFKYTQDFDDRDGLSDLLLNNKKSAKDKKKYIAFGLGLVVLFLLIIVIVRIASNSEVSDNSLLNENGTSQDNTTTSSNTVEEKYQQIINEKLKQINEEKAKQQQATNNLDIDKVQGQEKAMDTTSSDNNVANSNDVLNVQDSLEKNPNEVTNNDVTPIQDSNPIISTPQTQEVTQKVEAPQPTVTKVTPKAEPKPKVKEIDFANVKINKSSATKASSNVYDVTSGKYIQVGAFSKEPDEKFFNKITSLGYNYKILKVNIKGTLFYKVLIGPYDTHEAARDDLGAIKSKLNAPNAFLVKI